MKQFKPYTKEDKAVQLYKATFQGNNERDLLSDEDLPGTLSTVEEIRTRRANGEEFEAIQGGIVNTDQEIENWPAFTAQIDADIAEAPEEEAQA